MFSATGFNILSETEMFKIRGGTETDKPKTRPKEIMDWDAQSQAKFNEESANEPGLINYLRQWIQKSYK